MTSKAHTPIRTAIVRVTIGSFSLAALMGIIALLSGGTFGETEGKILLSTLLVGVGSVLVLCYLASAGTTFQPVGVVGGVVVSVALTAALFMIWGSFEGDPPEVVIKTFGVGAILAATLAQASLLLALALRRPRLVRRLLTGTLALAAVLAGLTSALVLGLEPHGPYFRLLGVVAILDVLGTVLVATLSRFGAGGGTGERSTVTIPAELAARLDAYAGRTGRVRDEVAADAVERYLTDAADPVDTGS